MLTQMQAKLKVKPKPEPSTPATNKDAGDRDSIINM